MDIKPQYKALQTRMVKASESDAPKRRLCPKCRKTKEVKKGFGFRTAHGPDGRPERTFVQSYCRKCRKGKTDEATQH